MRGARWLVILTILGGALIASERPAWAQWCGFSATSVSFGSYDVFSPVPLASTGTVSYRCLLPQGMTIWLGKGLNAPNNNPRQMASGMDRLNYNLYLDPGHTQIWGDPNPNHYDDGTRGVWVNTTVNVYGLIPAGQDVPAGNYTDSVTVTFNF
jgi:spore coat protein U-like protein